MSTLRLAVVTDIHHGRESLTKRGPLALGLLEQALGEAAAFEPDLVIDLGDRISDVDRDTDLQLSRDVAAVFDAQPLPHRHVLGNHDVDHLTAEDGAELFGHDMAHSSVDVAGHHVVFWQLDTKIVIGEGFVLRPEDLEWLEADLAATDLPTVICTHVPLDGGSLRGNFWFQNNAMYGGMPNVDAIQAVIQGSGKVVACLAGHVHRNEVNVIDGVPHITVQSLTESATTDGEACGAWATIEIGDHVHWRTHGLDSFEVRVPTRRIGQHWKRPLREFGTAKPTAAT